MRLAYVVLSPLLLLAALPSSAVDARGFVRGESCSFSTGSRLYLESVDGHRLPKPIALSFFSESAWDYILNDPLPNLPAGCPRADQCASVANASLTLRHVSRSVFVPFRARRINGISGDFTVQLSDGRKFEGTFKAKVRHPKTPLICM